MKNKKTQVQDSNQQCQEKGRSYTYAIIMSFAILMYIPLVMFYGIINESFKAVGISNQTTVAAVLAQLLTFIGLFIFALLFISKKRIMSDWHKFKTRFLSDKYLLLKFIGIIIVIIIATYIVNEVVKIVVDMMNNIGGSSIAPPTSSENQESIENTLKSSTSTYIVTALLVLVGAPFFEELVYRFGIIEFFKRIGYPIFGIIISTLAFGLAHVITNGDIINAFPYIVSGLGFTLTYKYFGDNIWYSILLHFMWNVIALISTTFLAA